jgi:hypothetical protein
MMDVCHKHNLGVIIDCINFRPETILNSFRFKVIIKNNVLPQIFAGYLLHLMVALEAFVEGSER